MFLKTRLVFLFIVICTAVSASTGTPTPPVYLTGPSSGQVGEIVTYTYDNGTILAGGATWYPPSFMSKINEWQDPIVTTSYHLQVQFIATGSGTISVSRDTDIVLPGSSMSVFVSGGCLPPSQPPYPSGTSYTCGPQTLSKNGSPSGNISWYWQGTNSAGTDRTSADATGATFEAKYSGTYYLRAWNSDGNGCWGGSAAVTVTVNQIPPAPDWSDVKSSTNTCGTKTLERNNPPAGVTWYWQGTDSNGTSQSTSDLYYPAPVSGTYYMRARSAAGCWSSASASIAVTVNPIPSAPPTPSATTNSCGSQMVTKVGSPEANVNWYWQGMTDDGQDYTTGDATSATYEAKNTGTYYLRGRSSAGCWGGDVSFAVTVNQIPPAPAWNDVKSSTNTCGAKTLERNEPPAGITWYWQGTDGNGTNQTTSALNYPAPGSNTYYLRARNNSGGCWSPTSASIAVTVNPIPSAPPTPSATTNSCGSQVVTKVGSPEANVNWYWQGTVDDGEDYTTGDATGATYLAKNTGTYFLRGRSSAGCWGADVSFAVTVNQIPPSPDWDDLKASENVCGPKTLERLDGAPVGVTWYWQGTVASGTSVSTSALTYPAESTGTYYLRGRNNASGCWSTESASITVTVNVIPDAPPVPTVPGTCGPQVLSKSGTPPSNVGWYWQGTDGGAQDYTSALAIGATYPVNTTGTYNLKARSSNGCWSSPSSLAVTINAIPPNPTFVTRYADYGDGNGFISSPDGSCGTANIRLEAETTGAGNKVMWYENETGGSAVGDMNTITTGVISVSKQYFIATRNLLSGCESVTRVHVAAPVRPVPTGVPVVTGNGRFGEGTMTLNATGTPEGGSYRWTNNATSENVVAVTYTTPQLNADQANYLNVRKVNIEGCDGPSATINIDIEPLPVISSSNLNVVHGEPSRLVSSGGYDSYQWKNESDVVVGEQQELTTTTPGTYHVVVTKSGISGTGSSTVLVVQSQLGGLNINYIVQTTLQKPVTDPSTVSTLPIGDVSETIQYFDGLGRPIQTVNTQASPSKTDLIQPVVYDAFGRESYKYLPVALESNGRYKAGLIDEVAHAYTGTAANFYAPGSDNKIADDGMPYAVTVFEASPLNRVIKQGAPGVAWQPDADASFGSADRTVKKKYVFNGENEVMRFDVIMPAVAGTNPQLQRNGFYALNNLFKNVTKDEEGHEVIEFTDKAGKVILKKVQATETEYAETYYVYDDFGNLVFVLPPEATKALKGPQP